MTLESQNYVGFFRRLIAGVIDFTILLTTSVVIGIIANACIDRIIAHEEDQLTKLTRQAINQRYAEVFDIPEMPDDTTIILADDFLGLESERLITSNGKTLREKADALAVQFPKFDIAGARKAGYKNSEIITYLEGLSSPDAAEKMGPWNKYAQDKNGRKVQDSDFYNNTFLDRLFSKETIRHPIPNSDITLMFPKDSDSQTIEVETQKFLEQYRKLVDAGNPIDRFRIAFPEFKHIPNYKLGDTIWHTFFPGYKESYEFNKQFKTYDGSIKAADYSAYITIVIVLYIIAYFTVSLNSKFSATFGKMALGIKALNSDNSKLTLGRSFAYTVCFLLFSIGTFFTTFLPVLFNKNRQALHDRVCKVMLVYNP